MDGNLADTAWTSAPEARLEYGLVDSAARPELSTVVRCLWSPKYLYVGFDCPFTRLTTLEPPGKDERMGLWERDVVEVFLGTDAGPAEHYAEFEVAPTNERLDVSINLPNKDFAWSSGFESAVKVDEATKRWTAELRIPLAALTLTPPTPGTRWRLNLFRSDRANDAFLAWNPTMTNTTHVPGRFGYLELSGDEEED